MNNIIIKDERNYKIISGNAISIMEKLPTAIYEVHYHSEQGFSLNEINNQFNIAEKIYGEAESICERVLNTFEISKGNLGVLFSGPKGLGKSLTTRFICTEAMKKGLPIILVTKYFDNIASFIETINQTSVIVFDEFEKHYQDQSKNKYDELEGQNSLLNLFDSTLSTKKLFLLTCNDLINISVYLLNRPGRIHYHFKAKRLSIENITIYCKDNLPEKMHHLISEICSLGARIPDFSYDMLKAILFELKTYDCGLDDAAQVLNIESRAFSTFDFMVYFKSGKFETGTDRIDPLGTRSRINWYRKNDGKHDYAMLNMSEVVWTEKLDGSLFLDGANVHWYPDDEKTNDRIEKIIFVPTRNNYFSDDYYH
jgi:hypothetical protein